jgi:hypothetical protein
MSRRFRCVNVSLILIREAARVAIAAVLGVLYGIAYAVIGYHVGAAIDASGIGTPGLYAWLFAWVAAGAAALTVWTLRFAEIDVRRQAR